MLVSRCRVDSAVGALWPMRAMASVPPVHEEMKKWAREEKGERQCPKQVRPVLGQQEKCGDRGESEKCNAIAAH